MLSPSSWGPQLLEVPATPYKCEAPQNTSLLPVDARLESQTLQAGCILTGTPDVGASAEQLQPKTWFHQHGLD